MKKPTQQQPPPKKPGPEADTVKIEGDWGDALKKALAKKKPASGWPDAPNKKKPTQP